MSRDIRSYDSENDIRNAWKVGGRQAHRRRQFAAAGVAAAARKRAAGARRR
jgi:hypothetical protein